MANAKNVLDTRVTPEQITAATEGLRIQEAVSSLMSIGVINSHTIGGMIRLVGQKELEEFGDLSATQIFGKNLARQAGVSTQYQSASHVQDLFDATGHQPVLGKGRG